jgi:receptor protein-tyrosine kinase
VAAYQPFSPRVEQLRAVRSQLMLRWFDKSEQRQTLAVVGAEKGEGRSYLAANLAVVFSQLGERTLLIDADLRHARQHELFRLDNKVGLSTLLAGRSHEEAIIRITDLVGLSVLPAGPTPPNPLELLNRPAFDQLLQYARQNYDVVLIDTPSLEVGDDVALISVKAGAALAIALSTRTRVSRYADMVQGLINNGVSVVGSVLNDVNLKSKKVQK